MPKTAAFLCLVFVLAMPCQSGPATTIVYSTADCRQMGGSAYWSNPALWTPMQVPDNGRPRGAAYDVSAPRSDCLGITLDIPVSINRFVAKDALSGAVTTPARLYGNNVSLTVSGDARIDELNMTNARLTIGGLLSVSSNDGWILTDSRLKTQNYLQDQAAGNDYLRSTIDTAGKTVITGDAWATLTQSSLETQELELSNGWLSLEDGATVRVRGNFKSAGTSAGLRVQLNGQTVFTINGNVQLGGRVSAWFSDGYVPLIGEEFLILRSKGSISGSWDMTSPPSPLPAGRAWSLIIGAHNVSLKVIPAP